jgi:peptidoglycan/xylan/chitin deacetylase (PgdA/CDA1 family)
MVDPHFDWGITRVTPRQFQRAIENALGVGVNFHTLSDYLSISNDDKACHVAITFDDGFESVYRHALPILKSLKVPATVFVIAGYVGQMNSWDVNIGWKRFAHLTWPQIQDLVKEGWEVGSHGMYHRDLTQLPELWLRQELQQSKKLIEQFTHTTARTISYPFGKVDEKVYHLCEEYGYLAGVVMGRTFHRIPDHFCNPRTGVYLFDSVYSIRQKMLAKNKWFYHIVQKVLDACSDGSIVVKRSGWY